MIKKIYSSKKKIIISLVLSLVLVCFLGIIVFSNSVRRAEHMASINDYLGIVEIYNKNTFDDDDKVKVENVVNECIDNILLDWNSEEITFDVAKEGLTEFEKIDNEKISKKAKENLFFIEIEKTGDDFLKKAEKEYEEQNYLQAIKMINRVDKTYSQYPNLKNLYNVCKTSLLKEIDCLSTVADYEKAIKKLEEYNNEVSDEDFIARKESLEDILDEYKDIYDILTQATNLYENKRYEDSFALLSHANEEYPDNNKIQYAQSAYQYAYMLKITDEVVTLTEKEDYKNAVELLEKAIEIYDCEEFQEELKAAKMKSDKFFFVKSKLADAGDYIYRSTKKMVMGEFSEDEQDTLLSLGGSVAASLANADAPIDIRDFAYDISHWGEGEYFAARLALDAVGIVPVIGAIKYIKHIDTVTDVTKNVDKVDEVVDTAKDVVKLSEDAIKKVINGTDVVLDVKKKTENVSDLTDDFSDFKKKIDKTADSIDDVPIYYKQIEHNINKSYENKIYPGTKVKFVRRNLDLSDGRYLTGVFPIFKSHCNISLPKEYWKASFDKQKKYLADEMKKMLETPSGRKKFKKQFNKDELADFSEGIIPEGYVWHHHETEGLMQLIDEADHAKVRHTGGMSIWGCGY